MQQIIKITNKVTAKVDLEALANHVPKVQGAANMNIHEIAKTVHSLKIDFWENEQVKNRLEYAERQIKQLQNMLNGLNQHYEIVEAAN
jgi:N-acetyl-anhydromuramyl-L-alanine amidase AmpD